MAKHVEADVSNLVRNQFPELYREAPGFFVPFVVEYYRWLESEGQALFHARRMLSYHDIDETAAAFLAHYKAKYLVSLQSLPDDATRTLVKHSLDLYRSRGTSRATDLLMKVVFGAPAETYYPGTDLMRLSSGDWYRPQYLEVSPSDLLDTFVGKDVFGVSSGAVAFVERHVRRQTKYKFIDVLYISAVTGDFRAGELVQVKGGKSLAGCPTLIGSLNELTPVDGSEGFKIGDPVTVTSNSGVLATAVVSSVNEITGLVDFTLVDGGWGFSSNAQVFVSDEVLQVRSAARPLALIGSEPGFLEGIWQPLANVHYQFATGAFAAGDVVSTYDAGGVVTGAGTVLSALQANTTSGFLTVSTFSGNLQSNVVLHSQGNAVVANLFASGFVDLTASGNVMNQPTYCYVDYTGATGPFTVGDVLFQVAADGTEVANGTINAVSSVGTNGTIRVTNVSTVFFSNAATAARLSGSQAQSAAVGFDLGIMTTKNFVSANGNFVYDSNFFAGGTVTNVTTGVEAGFQISNTLGFAELQEINDDFLRDYANVALSANDYGANIHHANAAAPVLQTALNYPIVNVGSISLLVKVNPGADYDFAPFVTVFEPATAGFQLHGFLFDVDQATGPFVAGELVSQAETAGLGIVLASNSTFMQVKRLTFNDQWIANNFANSSYLLVGASSGSTARLLSYTDDPESGIIGLNAVITANVVSSNGAVDGLTVSDSGYGYNASGTANGVAHDLCTFVSADGLRAGTAMASIERQGTSAGFYRDRGGFLSADKKVFDGRYYQDFSYVVKASVDPNKYVDMLMRLLHVAGTQFFGMVVRQTYVPGSTGAVSAATFTQS